MATQLLLRSLFPSACVAVSLTLLALPIALPAQENVEYYLAAECGAVS